MNTKVVKPKRKTPLTEAQKATLAKMKKDFREREMLSEEASKRMAEKFEK